MSALLGACGTENPRALDGLAEGGLSTDEMAARRNANVNVNAAANATGKPGGTTTPLSESSAEPIQAALTGAPDRTDARVAYWVDPSLPFASLRQWSPYRQVVWPNEPLADTPEPGILGSADDFTLLRGADPVDGSKAAFRHRISGAFSSWDGYTYRSEISANWQPDGTNITRGVDYWIAWAVKLDPDMLQAGNGWASILDFHAVPDAWDTQRRSPFSMFVGEGGWSFSLGYNGNAATMAENTQYLTLWSESNPSTTQWHKFVFKVRMHWDPSQQPYVRIWRAIGDGPLVQIASRDGPNAFNDESPLIPQKFGIYRWDAWSGSPARTMYSKGMYVLRDQPGAVPLDAGVMLALLNRI